MIREETFEFREENKLILNPDRKQIFESPHVCNFLDDNTMYACDKDVTSMALRLEDDISRTLEWVKDNKMVANPKKIT